MDVWECLKIYDVPASAIELLMFYEWSGGTKEAWVRGWIGVYNEEKKKVCVAKSEPEGFSR